MDSTGGDGCGRYRLAGRGDVAICRRSGGRAQIGGEHHVERTDALALILKALILKARG
jgi:hypothetical protein